jgi:tRNA (cmo5U34)-methyltransferase
VPDEWSTTHRIEGYLAREIPHRDIAEGMLLEALPERVERVLDLGTGDGRMLALVGDGRERLAGVGVDSSRPMLERARERFAADERVELRLHDLNERLAFPEPFDAVVSGLAIHHLDDERKRTIFGEVYRLLAPGGVFVNLDLVTSSSARQHERFRSAIGRPHDDPTDRLAGLGEQLEWLCEAGFEEVDCHFKWLELALMVAVRPSATA